MPVPRQLSHAQSAPGPSQDVWDRGYRLTFAEIEIELAQPADPAGLATDAPSRILIWQDLDQAPDFPVLMTLVDAWKQDHCVRLRSLRIATCEEIDADELRARGFSLAMH
jgi:uncharacterized protein Usg